MLTNRLTQSRFNLKGGFSDFWTEFRRPNPYRWPILAVSMIPFGLIMWWATSETVYLPPERPNVTYISSFAPDRTDEEIIASNEENQRRKDARAAELAELEERKRDAYRALGAASGFDVAEMEREAEVTRAEEAAAEAEQRAELYTGGSDEGSAPSAEGGAQ